MLYASFLLTRTLKRVQICEAVRDGGAVVWANTAVEGGLLGRSDLPLRTAVGAPVCTQSGDLCVLVLFSPTIIEKSPEAMDFLFTLAQVASNATNAFLPASNPSLVQHVTFPSFWWRDTQARLQRLNAIRESLPRDVIFDTGTLAMGPVRLLSYLAPRCSRRGGGGKAFTYLWAFTKVCLAKGYGDKVGCMHGSMLEL